MVDAKFWMGKRVFITGHTGFKGAWLCTWLKELGADVTGYSLPAEDLSIFRDCRLDQCVRSIEGDIRNFEQVRRAMEAAAPEVVFHLAACSLVRRSYTNPLETYSTNVIGTAHVLEAVRQIGTARAVISVASDKCYRNREWVWGYRECDPLGGRDPYSSSKAAAELVTEAYRESYFPADRYESHGIAIASVRAGNVIGGGDWAEDRLIPDIVRSITSLNAVQIRNPHSIRPWQHVLEPLSGYLRLAEQLFRKGSAFASAWNFGPRLEDARPVSWIVERILSRWENNSGWAVDGGSHPHEAQYLKLDCAKAIGELGWCPRWSLDIALDLVVEWYKARESGLEMREVTVRQIERYSETGNGVTPQSLVQFTS